MTLRVYVLERDQDAPRGVPMARSAHDLVLLGDLLEGAQAPAGRDAEVWLADDSLLMLIPRPKGGLLEVYRPQNLLTALAAAYGPLPSGLSPEVAERWLAPPHPEGITILQLLLARVLELAELARPGAVAPLTPSVEAVARAEAALDDPLVRDAWATCGPLAAVGTPASPGPLRDVRGAPAVLATRLLSSYSPADGARVLEATAWRVPNAAGLERVVRLLDLPDPRALGPGRLASLATLLRPVLETLPLRQYLATVSGRLAVELEVLLERLEPGEPASSVPVEAVRLKFDWLLQVDSQMAARFDRFADIRATATQLAVPAVRPDSIEAAHAGLAEWADFYTHRFLPGLAAWRRVGRPRDGALARNLFAADATFAQWIARAYPKLKTLPMPPLAYREVRRRAGSGPCIVLLVDGLAYELLDALREEALSVGIWFSEATPWLASLPTITDVGMLTSVAGLPADVAWADDTCQTEEARWRREELLRQREPSAVVCAPFQVEQIDQALKTPSELYVLVWSDVDSAAHRYGDSELFADHARVSIRHVVRAIARAVEDHPHLREKKDYLRLVVSADHGWTDLLEIEPAPRPTVDGAIPHHRLYEVPRTLGADEITGLGDSWVAVGGTDYDLPEGRTYLLPVENRPVARRATRQHGGLSMGEVFVPVVLGSFVAHAYRKLAIAATAADPLQRERKSEISLVLSNPNDGTLQNLRVTSADLDLRAEIEHVPAKSSGTFGPFLVRPRISGPIEVLEIALSYEGNTIGPERLTLEAPVQVDRTLEERMSGDYGHLDGLFDERPVSEGGR